MKKEEEKQDNPEMMVSDSVSTQSSFMDRISSIFSFRAAPAAPQ